MTVEELQDQIQQLDDAEFQELLSWVVTPERERREAQPAIEQAQADIVTELQDAGKLEKPEAATEEQAKGDAAQVPEWRDPGTDHSRMYHYGDVVRFEGKLVRSTHQGLNSWEPGTLGFDGRIWEVIEEPDTTETSDESETSEAEETEEPETAEQPDTPAWQPGIAVNPGQKYTHNGNTYEVIQAHTTQAGWEPSAVPALWKKL